MKPRIEATLAGILLAVFVLMLAASILGTFLGMSITQDERSGIIVKKYQGDDFKFIVETEDGSYVSLEVDDISFFIFEEGDVYAWDEDVIGWVPAILSTAGLIGGLVGVVTSAMVLIETLDEIRREAR